mgnify:FL=1
MFSDVATEGTENSENGKRYFNSRRRLIVVRPAFAFFAYFAGKILYAALTLFAKHFRLLG